MFNGTAAAADLGRAPSSSGAAVRDNQYPPMSSASSQRAIKAAADALMAGNMMMLGAGSDHNDPIPFQTRTPAATPASHPINSGLISLASSSLSGPNSIQAYHSQLSAAMPAGFATPQSTTGLPQSHRPIHTSQQRHMLRQQLGLSGSAAHNAIHNGGLASAPGATSSYLGSVVPNIPLPPQYSPQYASQKPPHAPRLFGQNQQQQVVVLLPSTAKIDCLQIAQVVDAVSLALQRTVEFKDLLMTVAPTPLVVMEPELPAVGTDFVRPNVDATKQGNTVRSDTQSVRVATSTRKATETQLATTKWVSIETQTEDSEMLRVIFDKTVENQGVGAGATAINEQESVVWFNKSDFVKQEQPSAPPAPASQSASQRASPLQSTTNSTAPSRAPSQSLTSRALSTSASASYVGPPSPVTSRLGACGLHPSALLPSAPSTPTTTPRFLTTGTSSPAYFPASPPRLLPTRPHLSHSPSLLPVWPPVINHPLTLVTPLRPANSGPAPYHVTLRNLRPSVTPHDLLYLARDLRTLVKVYYPPHAFFSFVGRAAVYFLADENEAAAFGWWLQGQIQRGKLRVVYELTEADVCEAETRLGKGKVIRWHALLAVTVYRPGVGNMGPAKKRRGVGREVMDIAERGVRKRMAAGGRESVEQIEEADALRHEGHEGGEEEDAEGDAGHWNQWEADMCRLFEDGIGEGGGVQEEGDDSAIQWVDHGQIAAMQGKKLPCTFRDTDYHVARYLLTAPLNEPNLALPNAPTRMLYRAVLTDVAWDRFEPLEYKSDLLAKFRLWASCGRRTSRYWDDKDLDGHIQMGWGNETESPFISFSCDLEWAVYYTLKQEFVGRQRRQLCQIQVPECHLFGYDGEDEMLMAFVKSASEVFAHRFVDVYSYQVLQIGSTARQVSQAWFAGRKQLPIPTYPFAEWRALTRELLDKLSST